jgi:hypothetical protein
MEIALKPNRRPSSFNYLRNKRMATARGPAGLLLLKNTWLMFDPHAVSKSWSPLPAAPVCRSFAQHATAMFFPYFAGNACTIAPNPDRIGRGSPLLKQFPGHLVNVGRYA